MTRFIPGALAACALLAAAPHAHAAQVCAWMIETVDKDDVHEVALWLQSDSEVELYYMIKGEGLTTESSRMHSPGKGTYVLHPGTAVKPWGFGAILSPPGEIDIIAELHAYPKSVFDEEEPPLITAFTFHRTVPEGETKPPADFAKHQCVTAEFPRSR